jgi:hypothetical protein
MHVPRWLEIALVGSSILMFVGSILAIPALIRALPADHFVRPPKHHSLRTKILRNAIGAILVALGIAMLVLPGQGTLSILIGLSILDLPVKHRILRTLLSQKKIQEGVQRIRAHAGKPPLMIPEHAVLS